jgi:cellulose biosynthesis protein BcsQ
VSADYYILDCPPKAEIVETEIMKVSDIVLIPFSPSPLDIWATRNLVEAIEARKSVTSSPSYPSGTPDAAFLLSGATKGTRLVQECIAELAKTKLEVMTGHTTVFTAYPRCFIDGETVFTAKEQNKEAQQQIIDITNEILERIKDDE